MLDFLRIYCPMKILVEKNLLFFILYMKKRFFFVIFHIYRVRVVVSLKFFISLRFYIPRRSSRDYKNLLSLFIFLIFIFSFQIHIRRHGRMSPNRNVPLLTISLFHNNMLRDVFLVDDSFYIYIFFDSVFSLNSVVYNILCRVSPHHKIIIA